MGQSPHYRDSAGQLSHGNGGIDPFKDNDIDQLGNEQNDDDLSKLQTNLLYETTFGAHGGCSTVRVYGRQIIKF